MKKICLYFEVTDEAVENLVPTEQSAYSRGQPLATLTRSGLVGLKLLLHRKSWNISHRIDKKPPYSPAGQLLNVAVGLLISNGIVNAISTTEVVMRDIW